MYRLLIIGVVMILSGCGRMSHAEVAAEGWSRLDTIRLTRTDCRQTRLVVRVDRTYPFDAVALRVNGRYVLMPVEWERNSSFAETSCSIDHNDTIFTIVQRTALYNIKGIVDVFLSNE